LGRPLFAAQAQFLKLAEQPDGADSDGSQYKVVFVPPLTTSATQRMATAAASR